jgi:hypothetical protein
MSRGVADHFPNRLWPISLRLVARELNFANSPISYEREWVEDGVILAAYPET